MERSCKEDIDFLHDLNTEHAYNTVVLNHVNSDHVPFFSRHDV
jgi:hypothetical protein